MNTYEKLLCLASEPFNNKVTLCNHNEDFYSSAEITLQLINDFGYQSTIDMRQACETMVVNS